MFNSNYCNASNERDIIIYVNKCVHTWVVFNTCMWRQYGSQQCHFPFNAPAAAAAAAGGHNSANYVNKHTFCVNC